MRKRLCRGALALALATVALAGCEKRERTKNSSGSSGLFEEGTQATTNVYRFVGVEQSLTDARKAVTEERWDQALAATDALLKLQPNNVEAKAINTQARLEMPNLTRWNELQKAASQNEVAAVIRQYRAIADTSMYKARATPVFDKLKADLAEALFSLPAVLGVEYGIGFGCAELRGSQNNDIFVAERLDSGTRISTRSNRHGGMLGGISSGMPIVLRAAIKPTSSLAKEQQTVTRDGETTTIRTKGRHDPCLLPRFVPMGEAMVAIVLADHWLRWNAIHSGHR